MVTGVAPSPPGLMPSIFIAHRAQQSHCSSIFHRVLLTHALALSASQFGHKEKPPRICTSMHSGGFELTKLTYTRLVDNLIRHRGDRLSRVRSGNVGSGPLDPARPDPTRPDPARDNEPGPVSALEYTVLKLRCMHGEDVMLTPRA